MAGRQKTRTNRKGRPDYWEEVKRPCNLALTPTAIASLDAMASELEISRSELVEQFARGLVRRSPEMASLAENKQDETFDNQAIAPSTAN